MSYRTRFAPSPTGLLHLGHAYAALVAWENARHRNGTCLLRIEDTDQTRSRSAYEAQITEDLNWLGLTWPTPVLRQSDHGARYQKGLDQLIAMGLTYPCRCTRSDIRTALSAPQENAPMTPDGLRYPGTCRARPMSDAGPKDAIRLNMARAIAVLPERLTFRETGPLHSGQHSLDSATLPDRIGDIVLARRDTAAPAYHLTVVMDDAHQDISEVTRGADLFAATEIHVLLQALLGLPTPDYHHHALIRDETGKRLAKRDDARAIASYRAAGNSPQDLRRLVGL